MVEILGGIEEARYGSFVGRAEWKDKRAELIHMALRVNGVTVARAETQGARYELHAGRVILPSDHVEIDAFNSAGVHVRRFEWGLTDRQLPAAWVEGKHFRFPSVFLLGAAKSGTTSLHVYLDQHPDIFMSKPKEPFFFEAEYERGASFYYNKYFGAWRGERVVGESRHRNLYLPYVPARIREYNPEARLIVTLRNPAERAISHWWHWRSLGLEPLSAGASFAADLARIRSGVTVARPEDICRYVATLGPNAQGEARTYLDSGYYCNQLERYLAYFRAEQLHIVLFEDLIHRPAENVRKVFRFLGIDERVAEGVDFRPWNRSAGGMWDQIDDKLWRWLIEHYRPHNQRLERLLNRALASWDNAPRPGA